MNTTPSFACFITVRTGSTRLPEKWGLRINGRRVIEHIIDRAKAVKGAERVIVCTSTDVGDDILETIAKENGVDCFRGSLLDKLARWQGAAHAFNVDYIVTVDGDDPFCDPELCDLHIEQMKDSPCDFVSPPKDIACGAVGFCFSTAALDRVCEMKGSEDTEMMWVYFTETGAFKIRELDVTDPIFYNPCARLTLDYPEDFQFFERVFQELGIQKNDVPLRTILQLLNEKPEIMEINWFRQQEFLDNQKRKTHLVLKPTV